MVSSVMNIIKKLAVPVTVMLVPHTCRGEIRMRMPAMVLVGIVVLSLAGGVYVCVQSGGCCVQV
jgi:hypothetical protein